MGLIEGPSLSQAVFKKCTKIYVLRFSLFCFRKVFKILELIKVSDKRWLHSWNILKHPVHSCHLGWGSKPSQLKNIFKARCERFLSFVKFHRSFYKEKSFLLSTAGRFFEKSLNEINIIGSIYNYLKSKGSPERNGPITDHTIFNQRLERRKQECFVHCV